MLCDDLTPIVSRSVWNSGTGHPKVQVIYWIRWLDIRVFREVFQRGTKHFMIKCLLEHLVLEQSFGTWAKLLASPPIQETLKKDLK